MNQFPTLIEYLLLHHDHVVIPSLGTFIAQQQEARRNEEEEAFLPPYRSVRFNVELSHDDDMLLTAICNLFDINQPEAQRLLGTWIDEFQQMLEDEGYVEFGAIGVFSTTARGDMMFAPKESGVTTPEYYGLDAFHMSEVERETTPKTVPLAATMEADEREITIRINRRIANWAVAACAAILLFMVFNTPIPEQSQQQMRSSLKELIVPQHEATNLPTQPKAESPAPAAKPAEKNIQKAQEPQQEWCVVMASAIPTEKAQEYAETLTKRGFLSARVVKKGQMVRVVVGHYKSEEAANEGARDVRQRDSEYQGAWVMSL